ncbi:MAG TPA: hypothetical protein VKU01_20380 [Bryobacteraceae bacterium]|nr:hypothetical protein [Bryobacteraceae bacterium]
MVTRRRLPFFALFEPLTRADATAIIANARRILTPNGIERLEKVRIGGADRGTPELLMIRGGPENLVLLVAAD